MALLTQRLEYPLLQLALKLDGRSERLPVVTHQPPPWPVEPPGRGEGAGVGVGGTADHLLAQQDDVGLLEGEGAPTAGGVVPVGHVHSSEKRYKDT